MIRRWLLVFLLAAAPGVAQESLRVATFNTGFGRNGPGLLLKNILDQAPDILATAEIIRGTAPDILLLTGFDNDYRNQALQAFNRLPGLGYPHIFAPLGNAGLGSGLDLNGNGHLRDWNDAWGFGRFEGHEGMALFSRYPITAHRTFDQLKWAAFGPAPRAPDGQMFFHHWPEMRLASHSFWDLEIDLPGGAVHVLAAHPTPPVFDGEEDANGLRNEAEISFLVRYLSGEAFTDDQGHLAPLSSAPVILLADLNADPQKGESRKAALHQLLGHPRLQATNTLDTADWESTGPMRVDYALPDQSLLVVQSGVFWPEDDPLIEAANTRHRLVWVDIALPAAP